MPPRARQATPNPAAGETLITDKNRAVVEAAATAELGDGVVIDAPPASVFQQAIDAVEARIRTRVDSIAAELRGTQHELRPARISPFRTSTQLGIAYRTRRLCPGRLVA